MGSNVFDSIVTKEIHVSSKFVLPTGSGIIEDNGTNNVTISNVAPAGVGTATISRWMEVRYSGIVYYIPLWT